MNRSRRRLLRAGAVAVAGAVAGCLGQGRSGASDASGDTTTDESGGLSGGEDSTTPTSTTSSGQSTPDDDLLRLSALDVAGSSGGKVVVKPLARVALIDFFATWCAPCKAQMKFLREVKSRFPRVHLISITSERDEDAVRSFWTEYEGTWPVALDRELRATSEYGVDQIPTKIVVDTDGEELWRHVGLASAETIATELREAGASPG